MNITVNGRVYHVETELELRELCVWWAASVIRRA